MKYLLILGNGFSMDLLKCLGKLDDIPLTNLISYGDKLAWPGDEKKAFISFRNTPNLWLLGVRPYNSSERNNQIIENIITCANAYYLKPTGKRGFPSSDKRSVYIDAYKELVVYLKYLFVLLDSEVVIDAIDIGDWAWGKLLRQLDADEKVDEVSIITFNYDLWLERVLDSLGIKYSVAGFEQAAGCKFFIAKPHGSISFLHKKQLDIAAFGINYKSELLEGEAGDFELKMEGLGRNSPIVPIIPPAGDSARFNTTWAGAQSTSAKEKAKAISMPDHVIVCGMSYWHVDRKEIDDIFMNLPDEVELALINPNPPETLDAVLTSLFTNYEHYTSIDRYCGGHNG